MNEIFFTSDTHFGHKRIIEFQETRRHFAMIDEMDAALIKNWNDRVSGKDTVYHLGDLSFAPRARTVEILDALNGEIHLIRGNHDLKRLKPDIEKRFASVRDYFELKRSSGKYIVLCHYPFLVWRDSHYGSWHLHGHSHGSLPPSGKRLDVGVDCHGLGPISMDQIKAMMETRTAEFADYHGRTDHAADADL